VRVSGGSAWNAQGRPLQLGDLLRQCTLQGLDFKFALCEGCSRRGHESRRGHGCVTLVYTG
jgi:hypothetical protein